jgi:hypothetical protein
VGINHYQAAKGALVCLPILKPGGLCVLAGLHPDSDPIGGTNYKRMMRRLGEVGPEKYLKAILSPEWRFVPEQWEAQMWGRLFQRIPFENLIYATRDIPASDFAWLPGTDARALVPAAEDAASLVQGAVDAALNSASETLGKPPDAAVLVDGPYGIPLPG